MARVGTANYRHSETHDTLDSHGAFWKDGIEREHVQHPYHPWQINKIPPPSYVGLNTTTNDFLSKTWMEHDKEKDEKHATPWAGKSAFHSPRFHGTTRACGLVRHSMKDILNWDYDTRTRGRAQSNPPLSIRSSNVSSASSNTGRLKRGDYPIIPGYCGHPRDYTVGSVYPKGYLSMDPSKVGGPIVMNEKSPSEHGLIPEQMGLTKEEWAKGIASYQPNPNVPKQIIESARSQYENHQPGMNGGPSYSTSSSGSARYYDTPESGRDNPKMYGSGLQQAAYLGSGRYPPGMPGSGRLTQGMPGSGRYPPGFPGSGRYPQGMPGSGRYPQRIPGSGQHPGMPGSGRYMPGSGRLAPGTPSSHRSVHSTSARSMMERSQSVPHLPPPVPMIPAH